MQQSALPPLPSRLVGAVGRPLWNEGKAPLERNRLRSNPVPLADGTGRRVVLVTGYLAGEGTVDILLNWLRDAGYAAEVAPMRRNMASSSQAVDRITDALRDGSTPAILIGHSRGGQQCRVVAQRTPELVSQLITLGSPVRAHLPRQALLRASVGVLQLLAKLGVGPDDDSERDRRYEDELLSEFDVDVPWTSIWSKRDGVVEWQACLDPHAESIEVDSSHSGLIASVSSFRAIASVLDAL